MRPTLRPPAGRAALLLLLLAAPAGAQAPDPAVEARIARVLPRVVAWRRDIHQHPELGNREVRTAKLVADHLRALGIEVQTGVAHTGVVGVLRGGRPGPVVALRADMDALPVTEQVDLPFASRATSEYNGQKVGVMHACGHDTHVAILMGVAEVLAGMRAELPGTVKFLFQPAEEGPPPGEEGGASMMVKEGAMRDPKPEAVFGLHVGVVPAHVGTVTFRAGPSMAAADNFQVTVHGRQTHGATPWGGVDPIVVGAQVVNALQSIVSRQVDLTSVPAVITVGTFHGGVRHNIIPDSVVMTGTIRTFDPAIRAQIHERVRRTAEMVAASAGATAHVTFAGAAPLTFNDPALTAWAEPLVRRVAGADRVLDAPLVTGAEDFPEFTRDTPGFYYFLGALPAGADLATAPRNHSPHFFVDEGVLPLGVRTMTELAVRFLAR